MKISRFAALICLLSSALVGSEDIHLRGLQGPPSKPGIPSGGDGNGNEGDDNGDTSEGSSTGNSNANPFPKPGEGTGSGNDDGDTPNSGSNGNGNSNPQPNPGLPTGSSGNGNEGNDDGDTSESSNGNSNTNPPPKPGIAGGGSGDGNEGNNDGDTSEGSNGNSNTNPPTKPDLPSGGGSGNTNGVIGGSNGDGSSGSSSPPKPALPATDGGNDFSNGNPPNSPFPLGTEIRSIEGMDRNDHRGATETPLTRMANSLSYLDDQGEIMHQGPNPRTISNTVLAQTDGPLNARGLSDMTWAWGQWLDHDIDLTESAASFGQPFIDIPDDPNDPFVQADCTSILFTRSQFVQTVAGGPREQVNLVTSFIDASNVYGSDDVRASALRTKTGGRLKTTQNGRMLPFNEEGLDNAGGTGSDLYLAGDIRANEQVALTAMHTLFVREHNRLANRIQTRYPSAEDEEVYQLARKLVGAEQQIVTYREFLPALLGDRWAPRLQSYSGYQPRVDPSIMNEFSTVAYRFGHSMLPPRLQLADQNGSIGWIPLRNVFFKPLLYQNMPERADHFLGGFLRQQAQEIDARCVEDVRTHLFNSPKGQGTCFDLAALNIHRGRDHGMLSYNGVRQAFSLVPKVDWADVTSDTTLQGQLARAYPSGVDEMDAWVGALAEDHVPGASVGELLATIVSEQFQRLMDGDKFFYLNDWDLNKPGLDGIWDSNEVTLEKIIRDNTILQNPDTSSGAFFV